MPSWPDDLPDTPLFGFTEQRQRNVIAFKPDVGPPKLRRSSTSVTVAATAQFIMTDFEVGVFNAFYEIDLQDGSLPFSWDHPITGVTYYWFFAADNAPTIERMADDVNKIQCVLLRTT